MTDQRFTAQVSVHVLLLRGDDVLLLRRANTGYKDGMFSVPAGHLDGGESVVHAAIREAREEVGVTLAVDGVKVVGVLHRAAETALDSEYIDFFVSASFWEGEPENCETDKCDLLQWCDLRTLPDSTIPYVRRALENYLNTTWFDSFGEF